MSDNKNQPAENLTDERDRPFGYFDPDTKANTKSGDKIPGAHDLGNAVNYGAVITNKTFKDAWREINSAERHIKQYMSLLSRITDDTKRNNEILKSFINNDRQYAGRRSYESGISIESLYKLIDKDPTQVKDRLLIKVEFHIENLRRKASRTYPEGTEATIGDTRRTGKDLKEKAQGALDRHELDFLEAKRDFMIQLFEETDNSNVSQIRTLKKKIFDIIVEIKNLKAKQAETSNKQESDEDQA